jgi:15-cis-phytoene synthase
MKPMNEVKLPADTFEDARQTTRRFAKTFYFASHALPPAKRRASYALYAFCRHVDNLADTATDTVAALRQLDDIRSLLADIYGNSGGGSGWRAFQETVRRYRIPEAYFLDLLDGLEMDLRGIHIVTFRDLEKYCYHVASVVGLMMTRILAPDTEEALPYAADLGTAMQLTNILRDIGEDHAMGRVYLPEDEMRQWGLREDLLRHRRVTAEFVKFMQFQIARTREFYRRAGPGIPLLPDDGSRYCVQSMATLYSRILPAIERNGYNVFAHRAHVSLPKKVAVAVSIVRSGQASPHFLRTRGALMP